MKKLLGLGIFLLNLNFISYGQYDEKALKILDAMSAKYKSFIAFKASIVYSLINESEGVNENFTGVITIKGDKFRLVMDEQTVVNDGTTIWTYLPDVNEVNIDNYDRDSGDISPSEIYTAYQSGYKYLFLEEISIGNKVYEIIDLVPEDAKSNQFFKVRMEISKIDKTLKSWTMFDKSGNSYKYSITEFDPSLNPSDSFFVFDITKFKDIEVIDLR